MRPVLCVMVGIAGAGKSTAAEILKEKLNATIVSSDEIRAVVFGDASDQAHNRQVFKIMYYMTKELLAAHRSVIYDATNLKARDREKLLESLDGIDFIKVCELVPCDEEEAIERQKGRDRKVSAEAIRRQARQLEVPTKDEGWDYIWR